MKVRSFRKVHGRKRCPDPRRGWLCVSQQHDQSEQQDRERANLDARFPVSPANSKSVTEQFWINPVTSKIVLQPLDSDTDAQLHKERVITVRKSRRNLHLEFYNKSVPSEIRTSWKLFDVTKFHEEIEVAEKTVVAPKVQR